MHGRPGNYSKFPWIAPRPDPGADIGRSPPGRRYWFDFRRCATRPGQPRFFGGDRRMISGEHRMKTDDSIFAACNPAPPRGTA